jgi:Flp pilus assembly protein TadD
MTRRGTCCAVALRAFAPASMRRQIARRAAFTAFAGAVLAAAVALAACGRPRPITVDYPLEGALFPPEFPPPTLEWHDPSPAARVWSIEVTLAGATAPGPHATSRGEPPRVGEIDPRAVGPTNELPRLTPERASAHTWSPDVATWDAIKKGSTAGPAVVTITGFADDGLRRAVSRGRLTIRTSTDPVGAPIFYRDVPLMPSKGEKGVIKPLDQKFVPLIAWRLRDVAATESRVLLTGMHSCANCHSFSRDGKTMGMDLDGPRNDKGLYALFPVQATSRIRSENVIAWSTYRGKLGGKLRVAFMSQVSPDARYVVTTINDPGRGQTDYQRRLAPQDLWSNYYIANFTDYRFLQVFYLTRGILAWYSRSAGVLQPLPGADDPRFVHTNAVWSPDGRFLVFARAEARDAYPEGSKPALQPNDPNETQIRYDLYRIPFDEGRGGTPVPIAGASANGMSNSFPKVSPDGRFIVFVKAKSGQLMRPDGKLYIVPVQGGEARLMRCNTPLMNSWHSFSPNGRWLVFSSKSRSPYTQLFLTHLDENGNDTPAVLIENSTAANRAANIPEFVNVAADGFQRIDAPVAEYFRLIDDASAAMNAGRHEQAIPLLKEALATNPGDAVVHNSFGSALAATGHLAEAVAQYRRATQLSPDYPDAHNNLALALVQSGQAGAAVPEFRTALALKPDFAEAHAGLGGVLAQSGRLDEAIPHLQRGVELGPQNPMARANLCLALSMAGRAQEAVPHAEQAVALSAGQDPRLLDMLGRIDAQAGRLAEAADATRRAIDVASRAGDERLVRDLQARLSSYESAGARGSAESTRPR